MLTTIEPGERGALAVVVIMSVLSLGMLGLIIQAPNATPDRFAHAGTPYSADHAAIPDSATEEQAPTF